VGAAAASARILGLSTDLTQHALGIAASAASGLKENMGSMVKPLHAGTAAQNGVMAGRLAQRGLTASAHALDGPQGYLAAMDSERPFLDAATTDLGRRWEILQTGITVKLYPSCAATHPPLDLLLAMKRREGFGTDDVEAIDIEVDSMTPRLLIHPNPSSGLEAKFSMPFCAAAAVACDQIGIDTFTVEQIARPEIQRLMPRVELRADPSFDTAPPLSTARVTVRLGDGRVLTESAAGARGYPERLTSEELAVKFGDCASRSLTAQQATAAWTELNRIDRVADIRDLTAVLVLP
jgi:2-methylcitrate dehydratase PrpD